jgi:aminoglycoside phosphotransferase (APT) family kinase protein
MLLPANRVLDALTLEFGRLRAQLSDGGVDGSADQAITNALQLLRNRQRGDVDVIHIQLTGLEHLLQQIDGLLGSANPDLRQALDALTVDVQVARSQAGLLALERTWRELISDLQQLVTRVNASKLPTGNKSAMTQALVAWESQDLLRQAARASEDQRACVAVDIQRDNLTTYLRDRFAEPDLEVSLLQPLAGGFGKQTILFDVRGKALAGSFVMRRDIGNNASVPNDCHLTRHEYPVLKAAHARGFPAPDALWLDTEHKLLPGGDFIVMRRSPGKLAGNFFGARTAIPPDLADALADVMARLHTLPPLEELGNLTDSIQLPLWQMPLRDCIERYIRNWYELFLREENTPSPGLMGLYGWLLDNVPQRHGKPVLLHGDIGFHNFLFDDNVLAAVLDWEFAHIGDPAEELGYVKVTVGSALDWERLMARYQAAGGAPVDAATLRYFQVWAYVRNATAANLISTLFANGHVDDLKLAVLPVAHIPHFIRGAQAIIEGAGDS